jgi:AcrR family transcriptional regulator
MAQIKKPAVRAAILKSATRLFSRKGYTGTTLSEIAAGASLSTASLYVYYASKLEILYAIYDPWVRERLLRLEAAMAAKRSPHEKLRLLLRTLWADLPAEKHGFVNNILQAISSATPRDKYKPNLIQWMEDTIERMLRAAVPPERRNAMTRGRYAHLLVMAFDGFILYHRTHPRAKLDDAMVDAVASMVLGRNGKTNGKTSGGKT